MQSCLPPSRRASGPSFTSLPREVRDSIYNAALININDYFKKSWSPTSPQSHEERYVRFHITSIETKHVFDVEKEGVALFLILCHQWATKSRIATEACIAFYANNVFQLAWQDIPALCDQAMVPHVRSLDVLKLPPYTEITYPSLQFADMKMHLHDVRIEIDDTLSPDNTKALNANLPRALEELLGCPNLRRVHITIYFENTQRGILAIVPLIELIAKTCTALRERIGVHENWCPLRSPSRSPPGGLNICARASAPGHGHAPCYDLS